MSYRVCNKFNCINVGIVIRWPQLPFPSSFQRGNLNFDIEIKRLNYNIFATPSSHPEVSRVICTSCYPGIFSLSIAMSLTCDFGKPFFPCTTPRAKKKKNGFLPKLKIVLGKSLFSLAFPSTPTFVFALNLSDVMKSIRHWQSRKATDVNYFLYTTERISFILTFPGEGGSVWKEKTSRLSSHLFQGRGKPLGVPGKRSRLQVRDSAARWVRFNFQIGKNTSIVEMAEDGPDDRSPEPLSTAPKETDYFPYSLTQLCRGCTGKRLHLWIIKKEPEQGTKEGNGKC